MQVVKVAVDVAKIECELVIGGDEAEGDGEEGGVGQAVNRSCSLADALAHSQ